MGLGGAELGGVGLENVGLWDPEGGWAGSGPDCGCGLEVDDQLALWSGRKVTLS